MIYAPWINDPDPDYAVISNEMSKEFDKIVHRFVFGMPVKDRWPGEATLKLLDDSGQKLGDSVASFRSMLVVSAKLKNILQNSSGEFEFFEIKLLNRRNRVVKDQYYVANLLTVLPCADKSKSIYEDSLLQEGEFDSISKLVLDESKIPKDQHIFRLGEKRDVIIVSKDLAYEIYVTNNCRGMIFQVMEDFQC